MLSGAIILAVLDRNVGFAGTLIAGVMALGAELKRSHTENAKKGERLKIADEEKQKLMETTQTIIAEKAVLEEKLANRPSGR